MPTCVIFDIDGTLVDTSSFEGPLYYAAVRDVLGDVRLRNDWMDYPHVTDTGILIDICADNAVPVAGIIPRVRTRFGELVAEHLRTATCPAILGALSLFNTLKQRFPVGIATGGWEHTARLKLSTAGYCCDDIPLSSADTAPERIAVMAHCRAQLPATDRTVYIGDGEWDLAASRSLGWDFIGVGQRLRSKCGRWVEDFTTQELLADLLQT